MSEIEKYDIAIEYRSGVAYCISGGKLDPTQSEHWKSGWEYAYIVIGPKVNDAVQNYIASKGYAPVGWAEAIIASRNGQEG